MKTTLLSMHFGQDWDIGYIMYTQIFTVCACMHFKNEKCYSFIYNCMQKYNVAKVRKKLRFDNGMNIFSKTAQNF